MPFIRSEHILENPLCDCFYREDFEGYRWGLKFVDNLCALNFACPHCKIFVQIPPEKFKAKILVKNFDEERKNYNVARAKQEKKEKEEPKFKLLEFPRKAQDEQRVIKE